MQLTNVRGRRHVHFNLQNVSCISLLRYSRFSLLLLLALVLLLLLPTFLLPLQVLHQPPQS